MGRHRRMSDTRVVMLKARITMTETGYPAPPHIAEQAGAKAIAPEDGWYWIGATPGSAARMARDGHKAVGTLTTTWYPKQTPTSIPEQEEPEGAWQPAYDDEDNIVGVVGNVRR